MDAVPADEMARLAAQVIDSVKHEQNPKFQKSEFMQLMRQLRDGEVTVEKDSIVPKDATTATAVNVKGKGRAVNMHVDVAAPSSSLSQSHVRPSHQGSEELNSAAYVKQAVDSHEAYFRQENVDFTEYWNAHYTGPAASQVPTDQEKQAWHEMQHDWDAFEATTTGVRPIVNYQFQTNNPYLLGDPSRTRHHALHMSHSQRTYEVRTRARSISFLWRTERGTTIKKIRGGNQQCADFFLFSAECSGARSCCATRSGQRSRMVRAWRKATGK